MMKSSKKIMLAFACMKHFIYFCVVAMNLVLHFHFDDQVSSKTFLFELLNGCRTPTSVNGCMYRNKIHLNLQKIQSVHKLHIKRGNFPGFGEGSEKSHCCTTYLLE
ncbi:hypothetical protein O6H91_01G105000 [Diphasiastrum complanatum]|uniref:Uncharacterized protein n=1 Tax=Diphasiastrum complanatum TaxID=34168 RepID=A0ACC2EUA1_DIPCM|nr:hypothetical protein O6H91_01G105000 [Diphasiastrum complanatum]